MDICVDFDGTIVDNRFPAIGPVVPNAFRWLKSFQESGGRIILLTMRGDLMLDFDNSYIPGKPLSEAVEFIEAHGVELYGVNENPSQKEWTTSGKVSGQVYIDDSAVGCPMVSLSTFHRPCVNWAVVGPLVERMLLTVKPMT